MWLGNQQNNMDICYWENKLNQNKLNHNECCYILVVNWCFKLQMYTIQPQLDLWNDVLFTTCPVSHRSVSKTLQISQTSKHTPTTWPSTTLVKMIYSPIFMCIFLISSYFPPFSYFLLCILVLLDSSPPLNKYSYFPICDPAYIFGVDYIDPPKSFLQQLSSC